MKTMELVYEDAVIRDVRTGDSWSADLYLSPVNNVLALLRATRTDGDPDITAEICVLETDGYPKPAALEAVEEIDPEFWEIMFNRGRQDILDALDRARHVAYTGTPTDALMAMYQRSKERLQEMLEMGDGRKCPDILVRKERELGQKLRNEISRRIYRLAGLMTGASKLQEGDDL